MASTTDGVALKDFGTTNITGFIVVSVSETESSELIEIQDEDGQIVTTVSNYGKKKIATIELIPKSGTSIPAVGATISYTSPQDSSVTGRIISVDQVATQNDVTKCTVTAHRYSGITPA